LLGYTDSTVALIEWHKRGEYDFDYYTAKIEDMIILEEYEQKLKGLNIKDNNDD